MALLAVLFFITALLYASVGFGGGSTYNALLVLHGADYRLIPSIALICNLIVVAGGGWRFARAGYLKLGPLAPFIIASAPAAWIGGRMPVSETVFIGALGLALLLSGLRLAFERHHQDASHASRPTPPAPALAIGAALGFFAGLTGIGGGIFLAPALYFLRWGRPREIAAACSFFILINSAFGLTGQLMKLGDLGALAAFADYWLVFPAVLLGGQIGSRLGSTGLRPLTVKRLTAVLILYVAVRLLYRWAQTAF